MTATSAAINNWTYGRTWSRLFRTIAIMFVLCASTWFATAAASAQTTGLGNITGTVTDVSGAVIPGAKVTITNMDTNVVTGGATNGTGYFEVDALTPGRYKISAAAPGFENFEQQGITLESDARLNVPLKLPIGAATERVVVQADATLLNTESGSSGQVLTTRQVESLPVSGNNPTWLALIAPGVQGTVGQAASTDDTLAWTGLTTDFGNYGQIGKNEFSLDGAPNESNGRASALNPTIDELGESKFDVTGFDASVGHTLGVNTVQTTKSGTNDLHGTVRETYTAKRWAAMNHFQGLNYKNQLSLAGCTNGPSTSPACEQVENKYGWPGTHMNNGAAALGGPVYIPKVFDGHNKLFFFVGVLDDVFAGAGSQSATVPTLQERTGNFSDLPQSTPAPAAYTAACGTGTPYFGQYQIYNPYSVTIAADGTPHRTPFCGNIIPSGSVVNSPMVQLYNSLMPTPTQGGATGSNYTYTQITPQTYRDYTARVDYKISPKDSLFVRYTRANYTKGQNDWTVGNVGQQEGPRWIDVPGIGWNHIFSATTNLSVAFGGTNFKTHCCYSPGYDKYSPDSFGLPSYTTDYAQTANPSLVQLPVLLITNYENSVPGAPNTSLGETDSVPQSYRDFAPSATLTMVRGHHTIRAGGEYRWQNASSPVGGNVSGTYSFDNTYTREGNGSDSPSNTGLAYAAFLLGVDTSASVSRNASLSLQSPYYGFYAGDSWRVTPKLTIIPGLRFEYEYGVVEKHYQMIVGWNPNADLSAVSAPANTAYQAARASASPAQQAVLPASLTIQGGPEYAGVNGAPRNAWNNSYRFLPRIAAAYQLNSRVVLRGGYGLFYDTLNALNASVDQDGFSVNTTGNPLNTYGTDIDPAAPPLSDPFPSNATGARFNAPIGSAAGAFYYLGASPTITDHNLLPARQERGSVGVQYQFTNSMLLDVTYNYATTIDNQVTKNDASTPASLYSGGQQPNTESDSLLGTTITNPFALANFGGLASTNPAAYNRISLSRYYTQSNITIGNLVRANSQLGGLSMNQSLGKSHFQELLVNVTRRYNHGLTLMASVQFNDAHDKDYFANAFDPYPSWEPSNNSAPVRFTAEGVYNLPFGKGRAFATSGWKSALFGGYQFSGTYEAQQGVLITFNNAFFVGDINAQNIKLANSVYVNQLATPGGRAYVQWLKQSNPAQFTTTTDANGVTTTTCTYSGTGFVGQSQCQPKGTNLRVFPRRVNGVRQMGMNGADMSLQRTFPIYERMTLETTFNAYNVFNHQILGGVDANPADGNFGQVTGDGWPNSSGRWLAIQGRLRF